ncbi:MAG: RagB/SusD family nutrient uptake outer membrane protein [Prevotella sp.]|nr:RagB/SusD family nutrient uptake outer membrane protein [Prevotella sp.]
MKNRKYIFAAATAMMLSLTGCTDWLEQKPISNVTTGSYFTKAADFESATNRLYDQLYGFATTFSSNEMFGFNFDIGTDLNIAQNEELSGTAGVGTGDVYYTKPYQCLRHVNNLLQQAETYKGTENINNSVGTAYFFRAWWHFFLLKRFGGVALMTAVPDTKSDIVWGPRKSRYEVAASILADLDEAAKLVSATKSSTGNNGSLTIEAVCAFKARVALFEGTWEKYNGRGAEDTTNGDGTNSGAGTAMPSNYPTVQQWLQMAKSEAAKFVAGGQYANEFSLWMGVEESKIPAYQHQSAFYLYCLEGTVSNPSGLDKTSNNEAIFRKCYDFSQKKYGNMNLTHSAPCSGTRKLMDMFLCTDGLPINISPLFKGYHEFASEFENRDARMTSLFCVLGRRYWRSDHEGGTPANYAISPEADSRNPITIPNLRTYGATGYGGRKYTEEAERATYQESADYIHIRLPEMLLTYAEATIELDGTISDNDLDKTVNVIRTRAHIANLTNKLVNDNGLNMKEEIRRERAIELFGEGFRRTDLCRWGIAEKELARPTCSYYVSYDNIPTKLATESDPNNSSQKIYNEAVWAGKGYVSTTDMDQSTYTAGMPKVKAGALITETINNRVFTKKNYLQPIPTGQLSLNTQLKQNPQW